VVGDRGRGAERALDIINHEAQPLRIEEVAHATDVFATKLQVIQPGQHYRLTLSLRDDGPGGKRTDTILLKTSSSATPVLRIPANTYLRERVYVFPDSVDMGALRRAAIDSKPDVLESTRQTLMIYQTGGHDFRITAESDVPMLELRTERGPKKDRYQIDVRFRGTQIRTGPVQGTIRIRTNDPQFPEVLVPVTGAILDH
jgi:hypothetical protein